ncbi:glycine cleavage system H-protein subunit [Myotisia sp. PD_48]|nr:glycine cleavage system H-protein subunit [Myotisia sp. PD_48]
MSTAAAVRAFAPLRTTFNASRLRAGASPSPLRSIVQANIRKTFPASFNRAFSQSTLLQAKKYTEQHEWIEVASDGTATVGITQYAANALGDVVYVELPQEDLEVSAGDTMGAVESVKSASDILSPVTGTVVEVNSALEEKPKIINDSPEQDGWFAKLKIEDQTELEGLMDAEQYKALCEKAED